MWQLFKNSRDRIVIKFAFVTLVTIQLIKKRLLANLHYFRKCDFNVGEINKLFLESKMKKV
jgi:hypothetical protein